MPEQIQHGVIVHHLPGSDQHRQNDLRRVPPSNHIVGMIAQMGSSALEAASARRRTIGGAEPKICRPLVGAMYLAAADDLPARSSHGELRCLSPDPRAAPSERTTGRGVGWTDGAFWAGVRLKCMPLYCSLPRTFQAVPVLRCKKGLQMPPGWPLAPQPQNAGVSEFKSALAFT